MRNSICRFRTGNHRLAVEVGRWLGKDYEQSFYTLCHSNKIGDDTIYPEILLELSKYVFKFTNLINTDNTRLLTRAGKFLKEGFESCNAFF